MDFFASETIKNAIKIVDSCLYNKIISFKHNAFKEKKNTFFTKLKEEYEFEKELLELIYNLEEKLSVNFRPFNWPVGYRFESSFNAYVVFDITNEGFKEYKSYYRIQIDEDIYKMKKHNAFFSFPYFTNERNCWLHDVLEKIGKKPLTEDDSINSELMSLGTISTEDLNLIGTTFFQEEPELIDWVKKNEKKSTNTCNSINPYVKLLKSKHDFILLRKIESDTYSLVEGVLQFELMNDYGMVFREVEKGDLRIRIVNRDINKIFFVQGRYVYSLSDILKYAGVEELENKNEFEHLITFSNYDLNIIFLIIGDMVKNKFTC